MRRHIRIAVTGLTGQVVSALIARKPKEVDLIAVGRPQLDLSNKRQIRECFKNLHCDAIINAAAYTAVEKAENEPDLAMRINGEGAGYVAEAAAQLNIPLLHLSTDYVFDGRLDRPYREDDQTNPIGAYGRSKLNGEQRIANIHANHVILRTAWVYSPYGSNFVKKMLSLNEKLSEVSVVADQIGNPTSAFDIADALYVIAANLIEDESRILRGIFHMTGQGEANWADFAKAIFNAACIRGRAETMVIPIAAIDYPTQVRRPANSRLDNSKIQLYYGITLPYWRGSVENCVGCIVNN